MENEKSRENRLRRKLNSKGYALRKSRRANDAIDLDINNMSGYMIVDANHNAIVAGERFDLSLDDVENWLGE